MIRILAPHFTAGVIVGQRVAPILTFMRTWDADRIARYCRGKGWRWEVVE